MQGGLFVDLAFLSRIAGGLLCIALLGGAQRTPRSLGELSRSLQTLGNLRSGFGLAVEVALPFELAHLLQRIKDGLVLDPFCRDRQIQSTAERDNRIDDT